MRRRRVSLVSCLLVVCGSLFVARHVSASPICESSLPFNIDAGALKSELIDLLQGSATFRRQCARVAATQVLRVTVRVGVSVGVGGRAQTIIQRYDAGGLRAEVTLAFGEDYVELLAHEFEHILEQVDGVRLSAEVAAGRAWLTASGAFETRRAFDAGARARHEYEASAAGAVHADGRKPPAGRLAFR